LLEIARMAAKKDGIDRTTGSTVVKKLPSALVLFLNAARECSSSNLGNVA
jgi:hypothetical protein